MLNKEQNKSNFQEESTKQESVKIKDLNITMPGRRKSDWMEIKRFLEKETDRILRNKKLSANKK